MRTLSRAAIDDGKGEERLTTLTGPLRIGTRTATLLTLLSILAVTSSAQETVIRRARPPRWADLPPGLFFEDAFAEGLRGKRPATLGIAEGMSEPVPTSGVDPAGDDRDSTEITAWSKRISAATLEDEIKAIHRRMIEAIENEGDFIAQGHLELQPHLATAAILFAVIEQFDGRIRWQSDAAAARVRFAQVAQNARAGSAQVLRQVAERVRDLNDLILGAQLAGPASDQSLTWSDVADRQLIMQRLEIGLQTVLAPGVASATSVRQHQTAMVHEGELAAMLASVLTQAEMPDAADDEYRAMCEKLERAAQQLRQAAQEGDAPAARQAMGEMKTDCAACHELYRG
jgi:soluble cytochrome b562